MTIMCVRMTGQCVPEHSTRRITKQRMCSYFKLLEYFFFLEIIDTQNNNFQFYDQIETSKAECKEPQTCYLDSNACVPNKLKFTTRNSTVIVPTHSIRTFDKHNI